MKSNGDNIVNFANSFQAVARLGLESISLLLSYLGNPQDNLKCVHVAGTNGKGSVCSFLSCILTDAGYKTGKYISPNMIDVTERISIDGKDISMSEFENIMQTVKPAAEKVKAELGDYPTQFELWTAAAFVYFSNSNCDICVIEVGLGGERDATNVISAPLLSIITSISMDHMGYLGDTISDIAKAKAGIIKNSCPVVTFMQSEEIISVLELECQNKHASKLIIADKATTFEPYNGHEVISYKGIEAKLGICGAFQPQNASLAIEAALLLGVDPKHIASGLYRARNMGRFEIRSFEQKTLVIDGAHNDDGMSVLMASLEKYFGTTKCTFIMGMMEDKEKSGIISHIKSSTMCPTQIFTVTVKDNPRAMDAESLSKLLCENGLNALPCSDLSEALSCVSTDVCVICGSLYLYKDLSEIIGILS